MNSNAWIRDREVIAPVIAGHARLEFVQTAANTRRTRSLNTLWPQQFLRLLIMLLR
jgi:hypothetical protein